MVSQSLIMSCFNDKIVQHGRKSAVKVQQSRMESNEVALHRMEGYRAEERTGERMHLFANPCHSTVSS